MSLPGTAGAHQSCGQAWFQQAATRSRHPSAITHAAVRAQHRVGTASDTASLPRLPFWHDPKPVLPASRNKATAAREAHAKFSSPLGDHVTLLNVWKRFQACPSSGRKPWCFENCISLRAMTQASAAHQQLLQQMLSQGCQASSCDDNMVPLQKALLQGLFTSAARHQGSGVS